MKKSEKNTNAATAKATVIKSETAKTETQKTEPAVTETEKTETAPKLEIINIRDCEVGDVIRYTSSKKPYIVAEKNLDAKRPFVFLFSKSQQYNSYKKEFEVVRLVKGGGVLPEKYEDAKINEILPNVKLEIETRQEAEKKAAEKLETETQKTEPVAEKIEEATQA